MDFIISASTDKGNVKDRNQDSLGVRLFSTNRGNMAFAVLCDGMGGLDKGELASASVVRAFERWSVEQLPRMAGYGIEEQSIRRQWTELITEYNEKIKTYGKKAAISLGTTVVVMLLTGDRYYIANVGDSRAYEITDGLQLLTRDQTVVGREVEQGLLTPEQAEKDARRSVLLQCVGASDSVWPEFFFGNVKKDAVYMLCSDGFRHEISPEEIRAGLGPERMCSYEQMQKQEQALILLNKDRNERDNISVVTIRTYQGETYA